MAHTHDVYDMENHFEINGSSRFIKETSETKLVVVQGDHKSEVLTFKMPRYIDGHDMTLCNKIRIHYINLDTKTNNKSADVYEVTDLTLCEECEDVLTFTWTIEAPATKYSGTLSFLVKFECTEGENVLYQWNTAKYVSVNVLAGIDNSEEFVEKYSNVLEEWYNELTKGADSIEELNQQALAEIELAKEDAKEDIQGKADATMAEMNQFSSNAYNSFKNDVDEKAAETLASIPEDYAELENEVFDIQYVLKDIDESRISAILNYQITKITDTSFTIESNGTSLGSIYCIPVTAGEQFKATVNCMPIYNSLGIVYATTTEIPEAWNGSNALPCLSFAENSPYLTHGGEMQWYNVTSDITVPDGCEMLILFNQEIPLQVYETEKTSTLYRKNIFDISTPTVTVGTITESCKTKNAKRSYKWDFNSVGSMEFESDVHIEVNDSVGIWMYCNFNQLDYANSKDGIVKVYVNDNEVEEILCAYKLKNGWNYIDLGTIEAGKQKLKIKLEYTLARSDYTVIIDSVELNHVPYKKPKILLSFDMATESLYTVRYPLLKEYGFPATFCNPYFLTDSQQQEMFADGWDWSIYAEGGINDLLDNIPSIDTGTVEEWTSFFNEVLERYEERGMFNPISYFSPANRGSEVLKQAEQNVGFRMSRIACSGNEQTGYFDKESFFIYTLGIGGTDTSEDINAKIDNAINNNKSICLFTHDVQENVTDDMNASMEVYVAMLEHIKELVEADKCEVVTFRQFYQYCEPNDYSEYMAIRHEKEKAYILGKLSN